MEHIQREVFDESERYEVLSHPRDVGCFDSSKLSDYNKLNAHWYQTIAIGKNGTTYEFPDALYIGTKQIYPPIINAPLGNLHGTYVSNSLASSNNLTVSSGITGLFTLYAQSSLALYNTTDDRAYIPRGIFKVTYATNMGRTSTYSTKFIPSWNTTNQNTNQFAYINGVQIIIKDPLLTYVIPYSGQVLGATYPNNLYTYFSIELNDTTETAPANVLKETYDTTYIPLAYVAKNASTYILRRQTNAITGQNKFSTQYNSSNTQHHYFEYYYEGHKLTNNVSSLGRIFFAPKHFSNNCSYSNNDLTTFWNGVDPNMFIRADEIINNPSSTYYILDLINLYPLDNSCEDSWLGNFYFIKVNGNENMKAFGQSSIYYNKHFYTAPVNNSFILAGFDMSLGGSNFATITGGNAKVYRNPVPTTEQAVWDDCYVFAYSDMYKTYNAYYTGCPAAYVTEATHQLYDYNSFTYVSYNVAQTNDDISDALWSSGALILRCDNSPVRDDLHTTYAGSLQFNNTYVAYCYLAATLVRPSASGVCVQRVLSQSYIAIQHKIAQENSGTYVINGAGFL